MPIPDRQLIALSVLSAFLISACTSLVSGDRPIPAKAADRPKVQQAMQLPRDAPLLPTRIDGRRLRIYKVAFDGTLNDRTRIPEDERETIIARIARLVSADDYRAGAGMQGKGIDTMDAMTGASCAATAEAAEAVFFTKARKWLEEDPTTEIRVFVTGFSRGAATARHFMNIVTADWNAQIGEIKGVSRPEHPRFYALLYDTVATGQHENLQLSLPTTAEYVVHLVATDEPRNPDFVPTVDIDLSPLPLEPTFFGPGPAPPHRLNTVYLPGAHSDIGASYPQGLGDLYIVLTEQFLYMMGLTTTNCWDVGDDPFLAGKHDSRGILHKLFGIPDPSSVKDVDRKQFVKNMDLLNAQESIEVAERLKLLWFANAERMAWMHTAVGSTPTATVVLRKNDMAIESIAASSEVDPNSVQLVTIDGVTWLKFMFTAGKAKANVILKPHVLDRIATTGSNVSLTFLQTRDTFSVATYVDEVLVDFLPMEKETATKIFSDRRAVCVERPDGSRKSPINAFVIHPDGTVSMPYDPPSTE